jgi:glucose-1-phosphate adenylyltransferase
MGSDTLVVILAGGQGSRLRPLTEQRTKAAIPFGGKYRIIDFPLANCLHSGLRQVLVLTQYKSHSLHKHLRDGWSLYNPELGEYITPVPAQMRNDADWYTGTADALWQNLYLLERNPARRVLVLPGDHVYRMDYAELLRFHAEQQASVTLVAAELPRTTAGHFDHLRLTDGEQVAELRLAPARPEAPGTAPEQVLAAMGIYLFDKDCLIRELRDDAADPDSGHDLGRDLLPRLVARERVFGYRFGGTRGRVSQDRFWAEVNTLDDYYQATMALLEARPPLNLYQEDWNIHTYQGQYPPARTVPGESGTEGIFVNSILASGTVIAGGGVNHSVLFPRVQVDDGAIVEDAILFSGVRVGAGAQLRRCILDKDVTVSPGCRIGFDRGEDERRFTLTPGGVVVIGKGCHC